MSPWRARLRGAYEAMVVLAGFALVGYMCSHMIDWVVDQRIERALIERGCAKT